MLDFTKFQVLGAIGLISASWIVYTLWKIARSRAATTKLFGPAPTSWLYGVTKDTLVGDAGDVYETWTKTYGSVYQIPGPMGQRRIVLTDPKAIAHCWARTFVYRKSKFSEQNISLLVCSHENCDRFHLKIILDRERSLMG